MVERKETKSFNSELSSADMDKSLEQDSNGMIREEDDDQSEQRPSPSNI